METKLKMQNRDCSFKQNTIKGFAYKENLLDFLAFKLHKYGGGVQI